MSLYHNSAFYTKLRSFVSPPFSAPPVQEQANLPYRKEVGGPVWIFMDAIKIRRHNLQIVQYYVIIVLIGNYLPGGDEKWQLTF